MHIELLVEEPSAEAALMNLLPRIAAQHVSYKIHSHEGKSDLLKKLPGKLKAYKSWMPQDWKIIVLIDEDRQDCHKLKNELEEIAEASGLITKTKATKKDEFHIINRVAIEELEAWFFGDVDALRRAYPRVPETLAMKSRYRDPDAIKGGTWESLWQVLRRAGYYQQGLPKIEVARNVSMHMAPTRNRSRSFQVFIEAVEELSKPLRRDG
jgi:hypothetical protein